MINEAKFRKILAEEGVSPEKIEEICTHTGGIPLGFSNRRMMMVLRILYYCETLAQMKSTDRSMEKLVGKAPSSSGIDDNDLRTLEFRFVTKQARDKAVERLPYWVWFQVDDTKEI
jgi:hypothetical protein